MSLNQDYSQIPKYIYWDLHSNIYSKVKEKIFVDVGAYDGVTYSNTYRLLHENWYGIYIEPNPISFKKLNEECYKRKKYNSKIDFELHECAAGNYTTNIDLYLNEELSSLIDHNFLVKEKVSVKMDTLNNLLKDIAKYNLLSIDTEGYEIEVLEGYNIEQHLPEVVIVETHANNPAYSKKIFNFCENYFLNHGYKHWFSNYINTIYIIDNMYSNLSYKS